MQACSCLGSWGEASFSPISGNACKEGNVAVASCLGKLLSPMFQLLGADTHPGGAGDLGHNVRAACWPTGNAAWKWWCRVVGFCCRGRVTGVILLCVCVWNRNHNMFLSWYCLSFTSILAKSLEICDYLFSFIIPLCVIEYPHFTDKVLIDFLALCREFGRAESWTHLSRAWDSLSTYWAIFSFSVSLYPLFSLSFLFFFLPLSFQKRALHCRE